MKITNNEILMLNAFCDVAIGKWDMNADLTPMRFAILNLKDELMPTYLQVDSEYAELLKKYVEVDENGRLKKQSKLIQLNKSEKEADQAADWQWKSEGDKEAFHLVEAHYMKETKDCDFRKYDLAQILETKVKFQDNATYTILKYITI